MLAVAAAKSVFMGYISVACAVYMEATAKGGRFLLCQLGSGLVWLKPALCAYSSVEVVAADCCMKRRMPVRRRPPPISCFELGTSDQISIAQRVAPIGSPRAATPTVVAGRWARAQLRVLCPIAEQNSAMQRKSRKSHGR